MNSKCKRWLQATTQPKCASTALLLLRLFVGAAFLHHGWMKIQSPFDWLPAQAPIHIPGVFQALAAVSEFVGSILLILGFFTRFAGAAIAMTMAVAVYMHVFVLHGPFVGSPVAYEAPLGYFVIGVFFVLIGPGKFSLDARTFGEHKE